MRVVVGLEPRNVGEADRAPPAPLLDGQERLELLGKSREVDQFCFRVAMSALCFIRCPSESLAIEARRLLPQE